MVDRLYPDRGPVAPEAVVAGLALERGARPERPYLVLNMVTTVDGRAAIGGRSGPVGGQEDREIFHHLRTQADAVLVGAGTARTERYGPLVRNPALRDKRRAEGLEPVPLAVIVSGSLDLPVDLPLLADADARVLVLTAAAGRLGDCPASVEVVRLPGDHVEMGAGMAALRERGVRSVLCEGGPTLNAHLLRAGLVDELFLSLASRLAGAEAPTLVTGHALNTPVELDLLWLLRGESHLFLRYRVRGST